MNKSYLAQHNIIYQKPESVRGLGMPVGNGDMVASFYTPDGSFEWAVGKTDIRDDRTEGYPKKFLLHKKFCDLVENKDLEAVQAVHERELAAYREKPYPMTRACCFLKIKPAKLDFASGESFHQVLSLYDAKILLDTEKFKVRTYVDATQHKLVASLIPAVTQDIRVELFRHASPGLGRPEFSFKGNRLFLTYKFPGGFRYVVGLTADCEMNEISIQSDSVSGRIRARGRRKIAIILAVATSRDCKNPAGKAARVLTDMKISDKGHRKWWGDFWKKSEIGIPDKMIENVYYFWNYIQASAARGRYPIPVLSQWYLEDKNRWHQDYHSNCNVEFCYYSCMPTNHLDLFKSYAAFFHGILPVVKKQTRSTYGWDGAKYPFSGISTGEEIAGGNWRYETYVTAWIAQLFWWYYEYSGDIAFLRRKGYEVIREVCIFYQSFLRKDENGIYYSFPCQVVEHSEMLPVKNTTIELAMVKELMQNGIKAAQVLNKDRKLRERWEKILNNLSPLPHNGNEFLSYEGASADLPLHHPDILSPVFPCGHINMDSGKTDLKIARNTFRNIFNKSLRTKGGREKIPFKKIPLWKDDLSCGWITVVAARLGMGETVRAYLLDLMILQNLKANGFFSYQFGTPEDRAAILAIPNTGTLFAFAVTQMLLQSHDGVIKVFPAIPGEWDVRFRDLRARGAFLVSSQIKKGKVRFVKIKSEAGNKVKMKNPWPGRKIKIVSRKKETIETHGRFLRFDTMKNGSYEIYPANCKPPTGYKNTAAKPAKEPRVVELPRYLANPKKKWKIYLGKRK